MMMEWDSRMQNTHSVQVLKAAIPFLDIPLGERIDLEGLFGAIRPFSRGRERRLIDMLLQFFQMKHMMEMMQLMQSMQQAQEMSEEMGGGPIDPMSIVKTMVPPEQQDMVETMMSMMSAMQEDSPSPDTSAQEGKENEDGTINL